MGALISAPIGMLGSCLGSCAGACALNACCKACSCKCLTGPKVTQLIYLSLLVGGAILGLSLKVSGVTFGFGATLGINGFTTCMNVTGSCSQTESSWTESSYSYDLCEGGKCKGNWAVYQVSFTLMCFFLFLTIFTHCNSQFSTYLHFGWWFAKIFGVLGLLVGTAFMDPDIFAYYSQVAKYIAPFFLLYQMIMFIDFGYRLNTTLIERDDDEKPFFCCPNGGSLFKKLIVLVSAVIYIGEITAFALMYKYFKSCSFNTAAVTTTLLFSIANTFFSLSRVAPHGALLTSAIVTAYCTWLCFGALGSMPDEDCNPHVSDPNTGQAVASIFLAAFAIFLTAGGAGMRKAKEWTGAPAANDQLTNVDVDAEDIEPGSYSGYHAIMLLCSIYLAMLLTNWGDSLDAPPEQRYNLGLASAWVQLASNWVCSVLYLWTLVIPKIAHHCCPDRDFGVDFDD